MTILLTTHYLDGQSSSAIRSIVHSGRIVAMDSPAALLARLGRELVEVRIDGDVAGAVSLLRAHRISGDDTFVVGATVHIPLHDRAGRAAIATITDLGLPARSISSRSPTLNDVYLQLTGTSLVA